MKISGFYVEGRKRLVYKTAGLTFIFLLAGSLNHAMASSGIDAGASNIYYRVVTIGKWVIIIKGALDTISNATQGDLQSAKKNFLGYMMVYAILLALPWGMDQVDELFRDL